jgi:hypothetical protein
MKLAKMIRQKIAKDKRRVLKGRNSPGSKALGPSVWSGYDAGLKMEESEPNMGVTRDQSGRIGPYPVRTYREENLDAGGEQIGEMLDED